MDPVHTATGHGPCERSVLAKVLAEQGVPEIDVYQMFNRCLPDVYQCYQDVSRTFFFNQKFETMSFRHVS